MAKSEDGKEFIYPFDSKHLHNFILESRSRRTVSFLNSLRLGISSQFVGPIDLFHNGGQIKYSFVLIMLISLSNLAASAKFKRIFA